MNQSTVAIVAVCVNVLGLMLYHIINHFIFINDLRNRIAIIEAKIEPFWKLVEENLAQILKHPHEQRKDDLLDRLSSLDICELKELECILRKDLDELVKEKKPEAIVAALALSVISSKLTMNGLKCSKNGINQKPQTV